MATFATCTTMFGIPVCDDGGGGNLSPIANLIDDAQGIVQQLIPLTVGMGLVAFFWFLIVFITKGGESGDAKNSSLKGMGYSILAMFVMVSIWGIIALIGGMLGIGQGGGADMQFKLPGFI